MSLALLSALEALTSFNEVLKDNPKETKSAAPIEPQNIKITTSKTINGEYVVLAVTKGRRWIKKLEIYQDKKEAQAAARRIGRQVKAGKYTIEW